jgi:hypothetical protein
VNTLWRKFIRIVVLVPHYAVMVLLWPLVWAGCLLSIWLAYRTAEFIYAHVFHLTHESFPELLSALLHSIELLLLIPLPGIVGIVAYRNLRLYLNPIARQRPSIETELEMAKRLVLGTLVSVAGTRMLVQLLEEKMELNLYISGGLLILSLTFFTVLALGKGWRER